MADADAALGRECPKIWVVDRVIEEVPVRRPCSHTVHWGLRRAGVVPGMTRQRTWKCRDATKEVSKSNKHTPDLEE